MANRNLRKRWMKSLSILAVGGSAFQLSGCDPAVRDALLAGLQDTTTSLSTALIDAFFISLDDDAAGSSNLTTT